MKYFVGIDQGYTKTDVLVGNENGKLLARYIGSGWSEDFFGVQIECINEALKQCGLTLANINYFTSSMTNVDSDDIQKNYNTIFRERLGTQNAYVYHDSFGAWRSAVSQRPSGVLAIGTAIALAFFHHDGKINNISDMVLWEYQAAVVLGFRAFGRACSAAMNYREPTMLTASICDFAETTTIEEALIKTNYGLNRNVLKYQHFVPYLYEAAEKGDKTAIDLIGEVGMGIAGYIRYGLQNLGWTNNEIPFVLSGGALKGKGYILENIIRDALADIDNITLIRAKYEPVYGALMLSYDVFFKCLVPCVSDDDMEAFNLYR